MTPEDRARLDALAAQLERMGIDDLRTVPVDDPWALAAAIRAALAQREALVAAMAALEEAEAILGGEYGDSYGVLCELMLDLRYKIAALASPAAPEPENPESEIRLLKLEDA